MDIKLILIFAVIIAAIWIYMVVREKINLRKAATGEDKERLRRAVAQALPGESGYQVAYGHYEKVERYGRKTITTYYCYALVFDTSRLWVMPLRFEKNMILTGEPVQVTRDMLGVAEVSVTNDKEGKARRVDCTLYDPDGVPFLDCVVEVQNTREDSYHHVNILQVEECARFGQWMEALAAQVNRENDELQAQIHTTATSTRKASLLGTFGIVFGIVFPPVGLAMGVVGLRNAKRMRGGTQRMVSLGMCWVAIGISILLLLLEGGILIYTWLTNGGLGG